jgi:hypothetical protein
MALEGSLGEISLASETTTADKLDDKLVKFNDKTTLDNDDKKKLEEKLLASQAGEKLKEILVEVSKKETGEAKKEWLVVLLKNFFDEDLEDNALKRLVVDGKSYLRLAMWGEIFDVELAPELMPSLIDRLIEWTTAKVNDWVEKEEDKVTIKYEKADTFIKETKEELAVLKNQIPVKKESFRDMFSFDKIKEYGADWGKAVQKQITSVIDGIKWFVASIPETIGSITGAFSSLKDLFKKKAS